MLHVCNSDYYLPAVSIVRLLFSMACLLSSISSNVSEAVAVSNTRNPGELLLGFYMGAVLEFPSGKGVNLQYEKFRDYVMFILCYSLIGFS